MALYIPPSRSSVSKNSPRPSLPPSEDTSRWPHRMVITGREIDHLERKLPDLPMSRREAVTKAIRQYQKDHNIGDQSGFNRYQEEGLVDTLEDQRRDLGLGEFEMGKVKEALDDALKH